MLTTKWTPFPVKSPFIAAPKTRLREPMLNGLIFDLARDGLTKGALGLQDGGQHVGHRLLKLYVYPKSILQRFKEGITIRLYCNAMVDMDKMYIIVTFAARYYHILFIMEKPYLIQFNSVQKQNCIMK